MRLMERIELRRFVAVQPPDAFPRPRKNAEEGIDFFEVL
jgi:hypothetical protein